jgi:microcystin-dependent protein
MAQPYIGQIVIFAGGFPPQGWAFCDGQRLSISQNTALFSLIGTIYGGDGRSSFALPDLRGKAPIGAGQGPGLTNRPIGSTGGGETVSLVPDQMPVHTHLVRCANGGDGNPSPEGAVWGKARGDAPYTGGRSPVADGLMMAGSLGLTGLGRPHNNMQPYLALTFIIALQGIFPPRG